MDRTIELAMARAFFASAWADVQDEKDAHDPTRVNLSGKEILDLIPAEIDRAALHAARTLVIAMEHANQARLVELWGVACAIVLEGHSKGDREPTAINFGHYCAMQAMGSGVGLADAFGQAVFDAIVVPYVEFGSHSLEKDY